MRIAARSQRPARGRQAAITIALVGLIETWLAGYAALALAAQTVQPVGAPGSGYAVQVGVFGNAANAERRLAVIEAFVDGARIFSGRAGSEARFFVIAGIFADVVAARRQAKLLNGFGIDTYIRPLSDAEARVVKVPKEHTTPPTSATPSSDETRRQQAVDFLQSMICRPPFCLRDDALQDRPPLGQAYPR